MEENALEFLFAGFAVFWAGLFIYLVLLQIRLRDIQQEVATLEERLTESENTDTSYGEAISTSESTADSTTPNELSKRDTTTNASSRDA
tara:strand:+ start:842 stop:1108 length:267 start_codon:yes stop_codon:yes gene_type:complete